jgi:hypothetical protein
MAKTSRRTKEIAAAFVFLARPCCSSHITGEILPIISAPIRAVERNRQLTVREPEAVVRR